MPRLQHGRQSRCGTSLLVTSLQQDCLNMLTASPYCCSGTHCGEQRITSASGFASLCA